MVFGVIVFVIVVIGLVAISMFRWRNRRVTGIEKVATLYHVEGLPQVGAIECTLTLMKERLFIEDSLARQTFEIPVERIFQSDYELVKKDNFSVKKAVFGELLVGPVGAMIGGFSGKKLHTLTIGYTDGHGLESRLVFVTPYNVKANTLISLSNKLRTKISKLRSVGEKSTTIQL